MSLPPALPLNSGEPRATVAVAICFPILATLAVIARFVARNIRSRPGTDDYLMLIALLATYGQMIIIIMSVRYGGVGFHLNELNEKSPKYVETFYKLIALVQFTFGSSLGFVKISLCAMLIRIFTTSRRFTICTYIVMGYCTCWMIMTIFIGAFLCRPFAFNWDKTIPGGKCGEGNPAYIAIAALDIVGDAAIIALPMPIVWNLRVNLTTKIALSLVFAVAFFNIIVAALRIHYLLQLDFGGDFTYDANPTYIWSVIEPSMAVISACVPLFRPLLERIFPRLRSQPAESSRYSTFSSQKKRNTLVRDQYQTVSDDNIPLQEATSPRKGQSMAPIPVTAANAKDWNPVYREPSVSAQVSRISLNPDQVHGRSEDQIWVRQDITLQYGETPKH